jgi:hypothetical protein
MRYVIIIPAMIWIVWRMLETWWVWMNTPVVYMRITEAATWYVMKWQILPAVVLIVVTLLLTRK